MFRINKALIPKSLNSLVGKKALQVGKTWSGTKDFVHDLHEFLVNLDSEVSPDFFVLLGVED